MMIGPRNSVVASLLGRDYDLLTDTSPWVFIPSGGWEWIKHDYPELWVDKIHDFIGEEYVA